jgi:lactam utilization protein B
LHDLVLEKHIPYQNSQGKIAYLATQIDTVCLHSDHPKAIERAQAIRKAISKI